MPRSYVQVLVADNEGGVIWAYTKEEWIRSTGDAEETALRLLQTTMETVDAARESVLTQAKPDLANVAAEQAAAEEEERRHG